MLFANLVEQFVATDKLTDKLYKTRAGILVYMLIILSIICIILFILNNIINVQSEFPFGFIFISLSVILLLFRYTNSLFITGNLVTCIFALSFFYMSLKTGAIFSEDAHGVFLIPLFAFLMLGNKAGIFWSIISSLWIVYLYYLSFSPEAQIHYRAVTQEFPINYYFLLPLIFISIVALSLYFLNAQYQKLFTRFTKNEAILEKQNKHLEEKRQALEELQLKLQRSNTELEQYAYTASHDLKQPIRTINSFATLLSNHLSKNNVLDDKSKEYLDFIGTSTKSMHVLVKDLLSYSKLNAETEHSFEVTDMNNLLERVLVNLNKQISENEVKISVSELPDFKVIPVKINQLFQNIISNAIKFRKKTENLNINITHQLEGNELIISISDNGIGIEAEHINRIFEPFTKLHKASEYAGSGIGLASCKRIVELHNGKIWLESQFGIGTTFYFSLKN